MRRRPIWAAVALALALAACGDDAPAGGADGGPPPNRRLVILTPPGDDIGRPPNSLVTLRVRYESEDGVPIASAPVDFALLAGSTGSAGGAALSSTSVRTDGAGVAQVDLVLGAEETMFRVGASAADAPTVYFYVNVSAGGFADLHVTPVHEGARATASFDRVEVRLYRDEDLHCADLDIDALPPSPFPPRALPGFGGTINFAAVNAGAAHTLVAWATIAGDERPIAVGCVDLSGPQLLATRVLVRPAVVDRPAVLPARLALRSSFDLSPLAAALTDGAAPDPWAVLGCPAGAGQLLLDCALDAAADDGALDCLVTASTPLVDAILGERGPADAAGCRPLLGAEAAPTLDAALADAVAAGGTFPTGADLGELVAARRDALTSLFLRSELVPIEPGLVRHRLLTAIVPIAGATHEVDLLASARPIVSAPAAATLGPGWVVLGTHGFTLDYGAIARAAFAARGLAPQGLDDQEGALGTALIASVEQGNATGCAALSALACGRASQPATCLESACQQMRPVLDARLDRWSTILDGAGLDFYLEGIAQLADDDADLVVDADGVSGAWTGRLHLDDGAAVEVTGTMSSLP